MIITGTSRRRSHVADGLLPTRFFKSVSAGPDTIGET